MRPQPKIDHRNKDSQGCDFCTIFQMRSLPYASFGIDAGHRHVNIRLTKCQCMVDCHPDVDERVEPCQREKIPSAYIAARFAGKHKLRVRHSSPAPALSVATNACTFVAKASSR